jgi:amino-acid N-acetyltransferase
MTRLPTIEPCRPEDVPAVTRLLAERGLPVEDLTPEKLDQFLVARTATGKILGCVGLELFENAALLRSLAVSSVHEGAGIGALLVLAVESRAMDSRVKTLYLLTTDAADYFRRLGYRDAFRDRVPAAVRSSSEFARLCPDSATCMAKDMGEG